MMNNNIPFHRWQRRCRNENGSLSPSLITRCILSRFNIIFCSRFCGISAFAATHLTNNAVLATDGSIKKLLAWKQTLTREVDAYGWTPLHCAARIDNISGVRQLLENDKSLAYITTADNDNKKTAIHIAASHGNVSVMKEILSDYPDCWETTNAQGQNILHSAVEYEKTKVISYIVKNSWVNHLLNQKDVDGNTPLHLLAASNCFNSDLITSHTRADKSAFNKKNMTPLQISESIGYDRPWEKEMNEGLRKAPRGWRNVVSIDANRTKWKKAQAETQKAMLESVTKLSDTQLIVAALIATVTFAAGFTLPGGYDGNEGPDQGMAILSRQSAFKAFVVTDTIALVFSVSAVFLKFISSLYDSPWKIFSRAVICIWLIIVAMAAMVIAFITGTYAVLGNSLSLANAVCVLGCFAFVVYYLALKKYWRDEWNKKMND